MTKEWKTAQQVARAWLYSHVPAHHRFAISSTYEHGEAAVINALTGIGYSWKTSRQLYLAHKEERTKQDDL